MALTYVGADCVDFLAARELESLRQENEILRRDNENLKNQVIKLNRDLEEVDRRLAVILQYSDPAWRN